MKKICALLAFIIVVGICIPVSASTEVVPPEGVAVELSSFVDTSFQSYKSGFGSYTTAVNNILKFEQIQNHAELSYIVVDFPGHLETSLPPGRHEFTYQFNGADRPGVVYKSVGTDLIGTITNTKLIIFLNEWDIGSLSGEAHIKLPFLIESRSIQTSKPDGPSPVYIGNSGLGTWANANVTYTVASVISWKNNLKIIPTNGSVTGWDIILERTVGADAYTSTIMALKSDNVIYANTGTGTNVTLWYPKNDLDLISVTDQFGSFFNYTFDSGSPDDPTGPGAPVTVYVRNSQTGAAIANSQIVIDALVDGDYYPVVNRTEPSGIFSMTLQPTGGGIPNPDGYRLIASADGYINPLPEINFTVDEYTTSIYCYLDPIAGGPLDENKTFIDFFVRDLSANPISGATVNFGGYTMITNSAGYAVLEVGKDATYTYTVSKSGYGPLTGDVVIGADPRHTINTVLAPAVTPTTQTPIPTDTAIGPTPTLTAPTGEPVSNWLEWFAAHFGMILGGGVEIGKIFMWLCFTLPAGVYVGKESKAGAAGFMAGAGIVTLFFVLIGWVPIWLMVLLALIIGLFYAKVFNTSDSGGGR